MAIQSTITLNNGTVIPQIGLGVFRTPDGDTTVNAVQTALENGYRHIDTAMIYRNETSVGEGIRRSGVPRGDLFVTTKLWNDDIRAGKTKEAFDKSLKLLDLDYLDLYLLHWPVEGWQQAWKELETLYRDGRVKAIGVCNFEQDQLEELLDLAEIKPAVNQIESNPLFANQDLIDFCHSKGIAVEAWHPMGGRGSDLFENETLRDIGDKYGKSPAQVMIRWHMQREVIPLPKSVHETRIVQNIHVFDFELGENDMARINAMDTGERQGADPHHVDF